MIRSCGLRIIAALLGPHGVAALYRPEVSVVGWLVQAMGHDAHGVVHISLPIEWHIRSKCPFSQSVIARQ